MLPCFVGHTKGRPEKMKLQAFILSLLILTLVVSNTDSRSLETPVTCATTCTEPVNVGFRHGFTYEFTYSANVLSSFSADSSDSTRTNLDANVAVDVLSSCEYVLRITTAELRSSSQTSRESLLDWSQSLQRNPLHFSWQNGIIPNICASNDDPVWVLNIKKGILSTLQVSTVETAEAIKETDVTGTCESSYDVISEGQIKEITKRKDYDTCEGREKHLLFSHFTPYSSESPRQNFIHSSQTCRQTLRNDQVQDVECTETHIFRPFSNEESGAQTNIVQSLRWIRSMAYVSEDRLTLTVTNARNTDLVFENENEATTLSSDIAEVRTLFNQLCFIMDTENYDQVANQFTKLTFLLRRLDVTAIGQVDSMLNGACPKRERAFRTMFKDALQWCGSEGCVVYSAQLIARGPDSVADETAVSWLNGISLITKPTNNMLTAMMEIVESGRMKDKTYLTAGTMINRLCEASPRSCMTDMAVRRALATFEENLGTNCRTSSVDKKQEILLSLRALGNAGRTNSINTLASCATEEDNDMETRIAAIQTFRRMPCQIDRSSLKRMMLDRNQDSEIRIASYMSLMKCPTPSLIQELVILLDHTDESQQVASFVWSHLKQVLESKDPLKGYMKPLLLETAFAETHDLDPRKYSKYYEASVFSEQLNAGATIESSVVWSSKSFVPRSADMGLSVDVFGQAVNLFEVGGRVEGMEQLVQDMLVSDGFMRNNPLSELLMGTDGDEDEVEEDEDETELRVSRSLDSQRLRGHRSDYRNSHQKELERVEPNGNWYLRVFGNEMKYGNAKTLTARAEKVNFQSIFAQLVQNGEYHYHDDTMLMNSAHILPTGVGLPLTIAFNGSASVDVNVNGNMNLKGLFSSPPNLAIHGAIEPRAVVVVAGTMSVDSHVTKTGIATVTTAITSVKMGGTATISNGKSFTIRIDSPYEQNTLFKFKHSAMKVQGDEWEGYGETQGNTVTNCGEEIGGQRLCLASPRNVLVFPTSGPIEVSAYTEKMDKNLTFYEITGSYTPIREDGEVIPSTLAVEINMNTPRSSVDRNVNINFDFDRVGKTFGLRYRAPGNAIALTGNLQLSPNEKRVDLRYQQNDAATTFSGIMVRTVSNQVTNWTTLTTLTMPNNEDPITGQATVTVDPSRVHTLLSVTNLFSSPVIFNVTLEDQSDASSNRRSYHGDGKVAVPGLIDTGGNFDLKFLPRSDSFKFRLTYQFGEMNEENIVLNHKRRNRSTDSMTFWDADQKLAITQYPYFNHHIKLMYNNTGNSISSMVKFEYGRNAGHEGNDKYILLNESLSYYTVGSRKELNASGTIDIPPAEIAYTGSMNHAYGNGILNSNIAFGGQQMHLRLEDNTPTDGRVNKAISLRTPTPWGLLVINKSLVETRENVYLTQGALRLGSAKGLSFNGTVQLENFPSRKRLFIVVDGADTNALKAESLLIMEPTQYRFENSITSIYNNLIQFNLNHQQRGVHGSSSMILFQHKPTKYLNGTLRVENNEDGTSHHLLRFDFNTPGERRQFVQLEKNTVAQTGWNTTVSFETDFPLISFNSLAVSTEVSKANERTSESFWLRKDDIELFGVATSLMYNQALADATFEVRQTLCEQFLSNVSGHVNIAKETERSYVTAGIRTGDRVLINTEFSVANNLSRLAGSLEHGFESEFPTPMTVVMSKESNAIGMTFTYTNLRQFQMSVRMEKNSDNQATFTLHQNNPALTRLGFPENIVSEVNYGTRSSGGKGIWVISTVNDGYLNTELMWNKDAKTLSYSLDHDVRGLEIPLVQASISQSDRPDSKIFHALLNLNSETAVNIEVQLDSKNKVFEWSHTLPYLTDLGVPEQIRSDFFKDYQSLSNMEITYNFIVDEQGLQVALRTTEDRFVASYDSSFPRNAGSVSVKVNKIRGGRGYKLVINKGGHRLRATVEGEIDGSSASFRINQNIFTTFSPYLPSKMSASYSRINDQTDINAEYNENSVNLITGLDLTKGRMSVICSSSGPIVDFYQVPDDMQVQLRFNNDDTIYSSAEITIGRQSATVSSDIDMTRKSITVNVNQNINALSELSVPESLHVEASLLWTVESSSRAVNVSGGILLNGDEYVVYLRRFVEMEEMPLQSNITFGHNIMELHKLGVPLEMTSNSAMRYSALNGEANAMASLSTELIRVYLDDSGNRVTMANHINVSADIELFDKKIELSLFHDLPLEIVPSVLKMEVAIVNSKAYSIIDYKSLRLGITRDSVKETALMTMNIDKDQTGKESLVLSFTHNATWLYRYGVPKKLRLDFKRQSLYDADISFVYDTMKKSVGVKFDYHGEESEVIIVLSHNFQMVENFGIPKVMGLEMALPIRENFADFEVKSTFGDDIRVAHVTLSWNNRDGMYTYRHHHNVTTDGVIPSELRITHNNHSDLTNFGFSTRVTIDRKYFNTMFDLTKNSEPRTLTLSVQQSIWQDVPTLTELSATMTNDYRLSMTLSNNRMDRMITTIDPFYNTDGRTGSLHLTNWQNFETEGFPEDIDLYVNGSYGVESMAYLRLVQTNSPLFEVGLKGGLTIEARTGFVELMHSEEIWSVILPKHVRVDAEFNAGIDNAALIIGIIRGEIINHIDFSSRYIVTDGSALFVNFDAKHDFNKESLLQIPNRNSFSFLFEEMPKTLIIQANATLDDEVWFVHSLSATYDMDDGFASTLDILMLNAYLNKIYYIPTNMGGSFAASWEDSISATIMTNYGDNTMNVHLQTDKETRAEFNVSQNWMTTFQHVNTILTRSDSNDMSLIMTIDGERKNVNLSGSMTEDSAEINFSHGFDLPNLPNRLLLSGSYRLSPDYFVSLRAMIDDQEHTFEGGFNQLENGFHVTTTILNNVRSATFRRNVISGGFLFEIDHSIPELFNYIPGSVGVSASFKKQPQYNMSVSIRREDQTQSFSTEMDVKGLQFNLKHDFAQLPIPNSISVKYVSKPSPLTYQLSVTINDLERTVRATFNSVKMIAEIFHSVPEIDQWFVARNIIVGVKKTTDPVGGELFISIDGLERRVGGSLNWFGGTFNLYHGLPEAKQVPRNITLKIGGSLSPLNGKITLTMDEIERSVAAEVNPRKMLAAFTLGAPETESFIPRHVSISGNFESRSGLAMLSFIKNERNQSVSLSANIEDGIVVSFAHDVAVMEFIPSPIVFQGRAEGYNSNARVTVGSTHYQLSEAVINNERGWYGTRITGYHNDDYLLREFGVKTSVTLELKGRKNDDTYEMSTTIDLLRDHGFHATASVTPEMKKKRQSLEATYSHNYNEMTRAVRGELSTSNKRGTANFRLVAEQTVPVVRGISLESSLSIEQFRYSYFFNATHSFPELEELAIPQSITVRRATLTIVPEDKMVSWEGTVVYGASTGSGSIRIYTTLEKMGLVGEVELQSDNTFDKSFSLSALFTQDSTGNSPMRANYAMTIADKTAGTRESDSVEFTSNLNNNVPTAALSVDQSTLNGFGIPRNMELSFSREGAGYNKHWVFNFSIDEVPFTWKLDFVMQKNPFFLNVGSSLDSSVSYLRDMNLPDHLLGSFIFELKTTESYFLNKTLRLEYNNYMMEYNSHANSNQTSGDVSYFIESNVPQIQKWMGASRYAEKYWYATNAQKFHLQGKVTKNNDVFVANYSFDLNTATKEFSYSSLYDNDGYDVVYKNTYTTEEKRFLVTVTHNGARLINIDIDFTSNQPRLDLSCNLFETEFTVNGRVSASTEWDSGNINVVFRNDVGASSTTFNIMRETRQRLNGYAMTLSHEAENVFTAEFSYGFDDLYRNGRIDFEMAGSDSPVDISLVYSTNSVDFVALIAPKRLELHLRNNSRSESMQFNGRFIQQNIKILHEHYVPEKITAEITRSSDITNVMVAAGKVRVIRFTTTPTSGTLIIKTINRVKILQSEFVISTRPTKTFAVEASSVRYDFDISMNGSFTALSKKVGRTSLTFEVRNNMNNERFNVTLFAVPEGTYDAEDFSAGLNVSSTFHFLPFEARLRLSSNYAPGSSQYNGKYLAGFNGQNLNISIDYAPQNFTFRVTQPWLEAVPAVTVSFVRRRDVGSENIETAELTFSWSDNTDDLLTILNKMKYGGTGFLYSVEVKQPSRLVGFENCGVSVHGGLSNRNVRFGFNFNLDEKDLGFNVSYTGDLPQPRSKHTLVVDIAQPFSKTIPSHFTTTGNIVLTSTNYSSEWKIASDQNELVLLNKHCVWNDQEVSVDFLWKQSYYSHAPARYIKMLASRRNSANGKTSQASLQIDDMPEISGTVSSQRIGTNQTLMANFNAGLIPVGFRELSLNSWYNIHAGDRVVGPMISVTLEIDNQPYHLYTESLNVQSRKAVRSTNALKVSHPLELQIFGIPLPNEAEVETSLLHRENRTSRLLVNYYDNLKSYPFNLTATYKFNDETNLLALGVDVDYNASYKVKASVTDVSVTATVKSPTLNCEVVLSSANTEDRIVISGSAKNFVTQSQTQLWRAEVAYDKAEHIVEVTLATPNLERTTLRGDLSEVLTQVKQLIQRLASEGRETNVRFLRGINVKPRGHDLYVGFEVKGGASHTLHLIIQGDADNNYIAVQIKKTFKVEVEIARASVRLMDSRLVQMKLSANPVMMNFVRTTIEILDTEASRKINWFADNLIQGLRSLNTVVIGNDQLEAVVNDYVNEAIGTVNGYRNNAIAFVASIASDSTSKFNLATLATENGVRNTLTSLLDLVDSGKRIILRPFTDVFDQYFGAMLNNTNQALIAELRPVITMLRKVHAGELLIDLIEEGTEKSFHYVMQNGEAFFVTVRRPLRDLLYVDSTHVIFNIPLAFEVEELKPMPSLEDVKNWMARSALAMSVNEGMEKLYSYVDDYYRARAIIYMPRDEMLPPFKGHAFVSDFRHFSTFDKRHYDFSSACPSSHVLAADMRDNNFTVTLTYSDPADSPNSIDVIVENKRVSVYDNYQVKFNGRLKELPLDLEVVSVMLEGNIIHVRRNAGDLDVACDFNKKLCTIDISPYYFGGTAGMAGVFNNEPNDDFSTPRSVATTPNALAAEWESSSTLCTNLNSYRPCASNNIPTQCNSLFSDTDSPLRPCFPLVDPTPFMKMCRDDVCDSTDRKTSCAAVHAYMYRCKLVGARVQPPSECVECSSVDRSAFDAARSQDRTVDAMDMVFVVEQGSCFSRNTALGSLKKFMKKLTSSVNANNMRNDVQYRLVGYGGPGANAMPSTITIRNKAFTKKTNLVMKTLKKMKLSREQSHADTLGAISYATQLPFRAGAKPVIVVLSCNSCHDSEVSYSSVERQIRKQGIMLHHLPQRAILAGSSSKSMFGFDKTNAFSKGSDVSSSLIKLNKGDMCEPLATVTGGSVWNGVKMIENNSAFHYKFSDYVVSQIGKGQSQTCTCEMNDMGVPTSVCLP